MLTDRRTETQMARKSAPGTFTSIERVSELKYAIEIPPGLFRDLGDPMVTLEDFFGYCHVVTPPEFEKGLFS